VAEDTTRWSETNDPKELARRKEVLEELVENSDRPYTLKPTLLCICTEPPPLLSDLVSETQNVPVPPPGGGWCSPAYEEVFGYAPPGGLELPALSVKRGGIRWPRFDVETHVHPVRRFLRRREWRLNYRYWEPEIKKYSHHYMTFASENDARNAQAIIKGHFASINREYHKEKDARASDTQG
jgi:hypothetical protein